MVRPSGDCVGPTTNVPAYANGGLTGVDHGIRWSNRVNWHLVRKSTHAPKEFIRTISTKGVNARQSTHLLALGAGGLIVLVVSLGFTEHLGTKYFKPANPWIVTETWA